MMSPHTSLPISASSPSAGPALPGGNGTFDTSIKSWLTAMSRAKRIKPGGKLVFINRKTGSAVSAPATGPANV